MLKEIIDIPELHHSNAFHSNAFHSNAFLVHPWQSNLKIVCCTNENAIFIMAAQGIEHCGYALNMQ